MMRRRLRDIENIVFDSRGVSVKTYEDDPETVNESDRATDYRVQVYRCDTFPEVVAQMCRRLSAYFKAVDRFEMSWGNSNGSNQCDMHLTLRLSVGDEERVVHEVWSGTPQYALYCVVTECLKSEQAEQAA